ncbi:YHS domain-containing (seleno)protein [Amorphus orientalis]|uniref:YHS domain-containing protein n=1 Tax=Amorphus orientalis TaxID=649198 RepID=A0AAE3VRM4_9HYPH|nr:YHS domain-containing (seleno)protein [Amorphus orientalis]MDQ0316925.1 YHS domain-containing protein [Amorphus orientalis]
MPFYRSILGSIAGLALATTMAVAGDQYVDETGFAVSGYDVVAYRSLDQAEVGSGQPQAVPGRRDITATYNGATFAFATEENREAFLADPAKYAPAYDGHCAYGVAKGGKVPGNPHLWRIVDGTLYLNITPNVVTFWEEDIPGNISTANSNWSGIEADPASGKNVPKLETGAAPVGG